MSAVEWPQRKRCPGERVHHEGHEEHEERGSGSQIMQMLSQPGRKQADARARQAFTLMEMMVVIVIIGILAAVLLSTFQAARNAAWKQKARDGARQIATAWNTYCIDQRGFPASTAFTLDPTYNTDAAAVTFETSVTNMAVLNARVTYLEQNKDQRLNGMKDKWGRYYHVRLDANYDGTVKSPIDNSIIRANVMVWSLGPHPNDTAKSWIMVWPQ
jgi:prepilin-type N-terminal cleavage/methylation domain-containing protein